MSRIAGFPPSIPAVHNYWHADSAAIAPKMGSYVVWNPFLTQTQLAGYSAQQQLAVIPDQAHFSVGSAFPNPLRTSAQIRLVVPNPGRGWIRLDVFSVTGALISRETLTDVVPGPLGMDWDGKDEHGRPAPSGMYFYRVSTSSGEVQTQRVVVTR